MSEKEKSTVAVFFGGPSYEHDISILTGVFVLNILKSSKFNLIPVYIGKDGSLFTSGEMFDISYFSAPNKKAQKVFLSGGTLYREGMHFKKIAKLSGALNCCHGGWGEGGGLSALLELNGVPCASPEHGASALFLDKVLTKHVISGMGIPTAPFTAVERTDYLRDKNAVCHHIDSELGYPVVVKPARLGSSIGVATANNAEELISALSLAFALDDSVLVERYLEGKRDINIAVYALHGEYYLSECEEPFSKEEIFSFSEKYMTGGKTRRNRIPAELSERVREEIRLYALALYKRFRFRGIVRADFLLCGERVYFCELNTVPGSLAYYLFSEKFSDAKKLFTALIDEAMEQGVKERDYPATGVLKSVKFAPKTPRI